MEVEEHTRKSARISMHSSRSSRGGEGGGGSLIAMGALDEAALSPALAPLPHPNESRTGSPSAVEDDTNTQNNDRNNDRNSSDRTSNTQVAISSLLSLSSSKTAAARNVSAPAVTMGAKRKDPIVIAEKRKDPIVIAEKRKDPIVTTAARVTAGFVDPYADYNIGALQRSASGAVSLANPFNRGATSAASSATPSAAAAANGGVPLKGYSRLKRRYSSAGIGGQEEGGPRQHSSAGIGTTLLENSDDELF